MNNAALSEVASIMRKEHDEGDGHFSTAQVLLMERMAAQESAAGASTTRSEPLPDGREASQQHRQSPQGNGPGYDGGPGGCSAEITVPNFKGPVVETLRSMDTEP